MSDRFRIHLIISANDGVEKHLQVPAGTTAAQLLAENGIAGDTLDSYLVRVNRVRVQNDYVLADGDRVVVAAAKINGAA